LLVKPWIKAKEFGPEASYGYGLMIEPRDGHNIVRHTGGMVSFASALQVDLDEGLGAFVSINAMQGYRPNPVAAYALKALQAAKARQLMPPFPAANSATKIKDASAYARIFTALDGRILEFQAEHERLFLIYKGQKLTVESTAADGFLVRHGDFDRFFLQFTRGDNGKGKVTELACGSEWYVTSDYSGPRTFITPKQWDAFLGHFRNENPWLGSLRVVRRKDKLWICQTSDTDSPLNQINETTFRLADSDFNPEWIQFLDVVDGRSMHAKLSGEDFWRVESK
jgi:hypothetical protein